MRFWRKKSSESSDMSFMRQRSSWTKSPEKPRDLPKRVLAGDVALCGPTAISSQLSRANLLSWSPVAKPTPDPVLKIKNIHCSSFLPARMVWGSVNFDHAASFLHVWCGGARIRWQGRRQRLAHGASTCRSHGTSTCTSCASLLRASLLVLCTTNLASTGRMILLLSFMSFIPSNLTYLSRAGGWHSFFSFLYFFYSRAILKSSRFLLASHSEKLAISICAPFLCAQRFSYLRAILKSSRFLIASHSEKLTISICAPFLCAQRFLFASHSEKLAIFSREPFWKARDLHLRAFSLSAASSICAPFFVCSISYLRAILKSSQSLFARHSEKRCVLCFVVFGFAQWNIWIVVLYISLPLCMGESDISFKKTFCLMDTRPQDFLSHEPTLWFRRR